MHRRNRIRRQLMPKFEIEGGDIKDVSIDHSKPLRPADRDYGPTNLQTLTNQLQLISVKSLAKDQKKKKKVKLIDTSKLLSFTRSKA